jgi:hypothetical protein
MALAASYVGLRIINAVIAGYAAPRPARAASDLTQVPANRAGRDADAA